jgi:hypothetical protein
MSKTFVSSIGGLLFAAVACSGSSSSVPQRDCVPGATMHCFGPSACLGGQSCLADGSGFGPCDCGAAANEGPTAGFDASNVPISAIGGASLRDASMDAPARSSSSMGVDAQAGPTFAGIAPHSPLPQLDYFAGPLITAPQIVTVVFADDPLAPDLQSFGASVASSSWWDAVRPSYCAASLTSCVGDGPTGRFVQLSGQADADYTDSGQGGPSSMQTWLSNAIVAAELPPPGPNTLYVIYFPKTTRVTLDGYVSCSDAGNGFDGYHSNMLFRGTDVFYAVVVECDPQAPISPNVPTDTPLQAATVAASHEIVEAVTDAVPPTGYVLDQTNLSNWGWITTTGGGEAGDLCVDFLGLNQDHATEGGFSVQRIWSNARAATGVDPCVPAPTGDVYFNAAPVQSLFVLEVGDSATFEVDAFSSGPMNDWDLFAFDATPTTGPPYLSFSITGGVATDAGPTIAVNNGSKIEVTVKLLQDPSISLESVADGWLGSYAFAGNRVSAAHFWPIGLITPTEALDAGIDATGLDSQPLKRPGGRVHRRLGSLRQAAR